MNVRGREWAVLISMILEDFATYYTINKYVDFFATVKLQTYSQRDYVRGDSVRGIMSGSPLSRSVSGQGGQNHDNFLERVGSKIRFLSVLYSSAAVVCSCQDQNL